MEYKRPSRFKPSSTAAGSASSSSNSQISSSTSSSNNSSPAPSAKGFGSGRGGVMPSSKSLNLQMMGGDGPKQQFETKFRNAMQDSNVRELKNKIAEMNNIKPGQLGNATSTITSHVTSSSNFNRSISATAGLGMPMSTNAHILRRETSPAIVELASHSPTDSLDEMRNGSSYPIVTSPGSELNDMPFSDCDSNSGTLTSPNLVVSSSGRVGNRQFSLANASAGGGGGVVVTPGSAPAGGGAVYSHEERKTSSSSKTKIVTDTSSSEKATATGTQMRRVQAGDLEYNEQSAFSASKARMETADGTVAQQASGMKHHAKQFSSGDMVRQESNTASMQGTKLQSKSFGFENLAHSSSMQSSISSGGRFTHQQSSSSSYNKKVSVYRAMSLLTANQIASIKFNTMTGEELENGLTQLEDLECITPNSNIKNVENVLLKYCSIMKNAVDVMRKDGNADSLSNLLSKINDMMTKCWKVPSFGHEIGNTLCDMMRNNGGLDVIIENCVSDHKDLQYNSAKLLQQCLVTENRGYVVDKGLDKVVEVAKNYTTEIGDVRRSRVGTGILEHLFKHNETTCGDVIAMGGLDTVVNECKSTDVETLRHCASALANVAMYGGAENQEAMIGCKVPSWLFPLAFHNDDTVKYFACLAIAALVANKEIEAAVQKSGTLELIEPFIHTHTPKAMAEMSGTHSHGQSPNWLKRLIPVLMSHREEARNLAAFHFCVEAEIRKVQDKTNIFAEIGALESLKKLASSPNGIASKFAAQTLHLIGEEVPHKLSQQVPTWSIEDVREWVKQIGFPQFSESFNESRVDGDLLLQLSEEMLREDISMRNGLWRRRFMRELTNLKRVADYSSCDPTNLNSFLQSLGPEYSVYTYGMICAGINRDTLLNINDEQLLTECGISNRIHRLKIQQGVKVERGEISISDESTISKNLDVFISYRRSNGSQLASLLKVHLEIRNFSVFLDVDRLEAGKFDNNLLQSIRSAKTFVLVLTPNALDRCFNDEEQQDWIHKEVACAIQSNCNIIPVFDNFVMPDPLQLPETMRAVTSYNGIKWIHDYQEACVDKIDRFIRGDSSYVMDRFLNSQASGSSAYGGSTGTYNRQNTYQRMISNDNSSCSDETMQSSNNNNNSSASPKDI